MKRESALILFVISLLLSYYFFQSNAVIILLILILLVIILIKIKKYLPLIVLIMTFTGFLLGSFLNMIISYREKISYTGLNIEKVDSFSIALKDDSFISSGGNLIYRGELISVRHGESIACSSSGGILLIGDKSGSQFYQGEILRFNSQLNIMEESKEFSYIAFSSKEPERISWQFPILTFRSKIKKKIEDKMDNLSPDVSSLFKALFTGNSDSLPRQIKESFRKSGVMHLLALSGFHVAIIVLFFTVLLKPIVGKKGAFLISIPLIIFYLFFAGAGPSLLRAVLMYVIGGIFYCFNRKISLLTILFLTIIIQLLISPVQGYSLSFQLSYLALAGIIILGKVISFRLKPLFPQFLSLPLSASIAAQIITAPLLIFHFRELYPIGIFSALLLTPLITLFMWIAIISLICSVFFDGTLLFNLCLFFSEKIYRATIWASTLFSSVRKLSFSSKSGIVIYLSILVITVILLYTDFWRLNERRKSLGSKLRFTLRDKGIAGNNGSRPKKKMESEFSDKQGRQRKTGKLDCC